MVSLEQVRLLETKVVKTLDYVKLLSEENGILRGKLEGYRKRIDELEVLIKAFRDDQGRIETSILSALDRLNQFEDAIEQGLARAETEAALDEKSAAPVSVIDPYAEGEAIDPDVDDDQRAAISSAPAADVDDSEIPSDDEGQPVDNIRGDELDIF